MQPSNLDQVLWVVGFLENLALLCLLLFTGRARNFPAFTSLIALSVLRTVVLFFLLHHGGKLSYFYGYWLFVIVDVGLQILVVGEAAIHVFRPVRTWVPGSRGSLAILLLAASVVSAIITWTATPSTQYLRQSVVIKGDLFSSVLIGELFVGLIAMSVTMGLPLKTDAARIVEVLGFISLKDIIIHSLQAHFGVGQGSSTFVALSRVGIAIYCFLLGYWIFAFRKKAVAPRELPDRMREQLLVLNNRMATELRNLQSLGR